MYVWMLLTLIARGFDYSKPDLPIDITDIEFIALDIYGGITHTYIHPYAHTYIHTYLDASEIVYNVKVDDHESVSILPAQSTDDVTLQQVWYCIC